MSFLLAQILLCLLIAGLIGALIGWLLRGGCKAKIDKLKDQWDKHYNSEKDIWQGKISEYESRLNALKGDLSQKETLLAKKDEEFNLKIKELQNDHENRLKSVHGEWEGKIQSLKSDYEAKLPDADELKKVKEELENTKAQLAKKDEEFNLKIKELQNDHENRLKSVHGEWEGKIQSLKSDYDKKIRSIDDQKNSLSKELESIKSDADKIALEDAKIFKAVGNLDDSYDIESIEGIGPGFGKRLKNLGIHTTDEFAHRFLGNEEAIQKLSKDTKIDAEAIRAWASMADLMKLPGVDGQYAEIMHVVGVKDREDLSKRDPKTLYQQMVEFNKKNPIVPEVPGIGLLVKWSKLPDAKKVKEAVNNLSTDNRPTASKEGRESHDLTFIEGIGPGFSKRFNELGIYTTDEFADKFLGNEEEIKKASIKTKIDEEAIRSWASMADLVRISGIDGQYAEILQAVGVNSREDLARKDINILYQKMVEFNKNSPIVPEVPTRSMLNDWINEIENS